MSNYSRQWQKMNSSCCFIRNLKENGIENCVFVLKTNFRFVRVNYSSEGQLSCHKNHHKNVLFISMFSRARAFHTFNGHLWQTELHLLAIEYLEFISINRTRLFASVFSLRFVFYLLRAHSIARTNRNDHLCRVCAERIPANETAV